MKKVLFFHIYPVNHWREVTQHLLCNVPHEDIFVHVSIPTDLSVNRQQIDQFLAGFPKVRSVLYSQNSTHPEVDAMEKLLDYVDLSSYNVLTYMHAKGVTKPASRNVDDWRELMRYFVVDKISLCEKVFEKGYLLYGVNKTEITDTDTDFDGAGFFYAGNFVSVNLTREMLAKLKTTPLSKHYYALEGFWGKLCPSRLAYNAFHSRINHYLTAFPERYYKNGLGRIKYSVISFCYSQYYELRQKFTCLL